MKPSSKSDKQRKILQNYISPLLYRMAFNIPVLCFLALIIYGSPGEGTQDQRAAVATAAGTLYCTPTDSLVGQQIYIKFWIVLNILVKLPRSLREGFNINPSSFYY